MPTYPRAELDEMMQRWIAANDRAEADPFNHEICAAKMAMLTGRPVKIALTREEVFYCHRGRHPGLDEAPRSG